MKGLKVILVIQINEEFFIKCIDYKWVGDKDQKKSKNHKKDIGIIDCEEPKRNSDIFNLLKGKV